MVQGGGLRLGLRGCPRGGRVGIDGALGISILERHPCLPGREQVSLPGLAQSLSDIATRMDSRVHARRHRGPESWVSEADTSQKE